MINLEENVMGQCCCCGGMIPISETMCNFCLDDMNKQSAYEEYLDRMDYDHE